jgi:predicted enzyme related to lactoylglutathione lyase
MSRVIHFEIHAESPERAISFYKSVFSWEITKWPSPTDYWVIKTGPDGQPGINGGLMKRMGPIDGTAVITYVCTIDTDSVDATAAKVKAAGGTVVVPKMVIPTVGWLVYCKDTEGNIFGIMQADKNAA